MAMSLIWPAAATCSCATWFLNVSPAAYAKKGIEWEMIDPNIAVIAL